MNQITNTITMTSREIAELVESRHDNVKRAIERLVDRMVIELPPTEGVKNHLGQTVESYVFSGEKGKRDSFVVVAQLSPEFTGALVDRWQELEQQVAKPQLPDFTNPVEAARAWADAVEQTQIQAAQIEKNKPKVEFFDRVVEQDTLHTATQVGAMLGMSARALNQRLDALHFYNKSVKRTRMFRSWVLDQGYGVTKVVEGGYTQSLFTIKGVDYIVQLFSPDIDAGLYKALAHAE